MSVGEALAAGFSVAHRRIGSVLGDLVWKVIWLALSALLTLAFFLWLYSTAGSIEVIVPQDALGSPLTAAILLRELWDAYASTVFWMLIGLLALSLVAWILLESYFRAALMPLPIANEHFRRSARRNFRLFLISVVTKLMISGSVAVILGMTVFGRYLTTPYGEWDDLWVETRSPLFVALFVSITLWLGLAVMETLIRSNAVTLLGSDLFLVSGVFGVLLTFETLVVLSIGIVLLTLLTTLSGPTGILVFAGATAAAIIFVNVLHSYLLVVRFSSIAIMCPGRIDLTRV